MHRTTLALAIPTLVLALACGGGGDGARPALSEPTCCTTEWANGEVGYGFEPCEDEWTPTSGPVCTEVCCRMEDMGGGVNHKTVPAGSCQEGMEWGNGYVDDASACEP